jgi:hypothetical protein
MGEWRIGRLQRLCSLSKPVRTEGCPFAPAHRIVRTDTDAGSRCPLVEQRCCGRSALSGRERTSRPYESVGDPRRRPHYAHEPCSVSTSQGGCPAIRERDVLPPSAAGLSAVACFMLVVPAAVRHWCGCRPRWRLGLPSVLLSSVTALWCYVRERSAALVDDLDDLRPVSSGSPHVRGVRPVVVLLDHATNGADPLSNLALVHVAVALSMVVLLIWTSLVGLVLVSPRLARWAPLDQIRRPQREVRPRRSTRIRCLVSLPALRLIGMGRFAYVGDPSLNLVERSSLVNLLNLASPLALYGAAVRVVELLGRPIFQFALMVGYSMFATLVMVGLFSGFKGSAIVPAMAVIIIYRIAKGRYPTHLLIGAAIGVVLVFPFNTTYRTEVRYIGTDPVDGALCRGNGCSAGLSCGPSRGDQQHR